MTTRDKNRNGQLSVSVLGCSLTRAPTYAYVDLVFTTLMKLITPGSLGNAQAT
jgi:hypothetical protein